MRLLLVANGYPPDARGGVETYTQLIAEALLQRGHAVAVFCRVSDLRAPEYALRTETIGGVPVWRVVNDLTGAASFRAHYEDRRIERRFLAAAEAFRPDLVHLQHALGLSASLLPAARARGWPLVVTVHDFWYFCPRATLFTAEQTVCAGPGPAVDCVRCLGGVRLGPAAWLQRLPLYKRLLAWLPRRTNQSLRARLARPASAPAASAAGRQAEAQARTAQLFAWLALAQRLLTPSEFVRAQYAAHGFPAERLTVLPLGLERAPLEAVERRPEAPVTLAYLGTLQYHKGVDLLIEALRLRPALPVRVRVYGSGDPADSYTQRVRQAALADPRLEFLGAFERQRLPAVLAGVDVVVIPSRAYETYSLAAREALTAGVPVVAARMGALAEAVQDGVNGRLVPPDDPAALAQALAEVTADLPRFRAGARATRRGSAPSLDEHIQALLEIYEGARRNAALAGQ